MLQEGIARLDERLAKGGYDETDNLGPADIRRWRDTDAVRLAEWKRNLARIVAEEQERARQRLRLLDKPPAPLG